MKREKLVRIFDPTRVNTYGTNVGLLDSLRLIASNKYLNVIELNFGKKCKMLNFTGYDVILSDY